MVSLLFMKSLISCSICVTSWRQQRVAIRAGEHQDKKFAWWLYLDEQSKTVRSAIEGTVHMHLAKKIIAF